MNLQDVMQKTTTFFKQKNFATPKLDAELLIANVLKLSRLELYLKFEYPLKQDELQKCRDLVKRRAQGEPVAYILKEKGFYNSTFYVDERVLIPRPETEFIVDEVVAWAKQQPQQDFTFADLGCGSGCIGLSLVKELAVKKLLSIDLSEGAIEVAKKNAQLLGLEDHIEYLCKDVAEVEAGELGEDFSSGFDAIIANPPYINRDSEDFEENVEKYEPSMALFADDQGMKCIKQWSQKALQLLKPGGLYCFEIGYDQGSLACDYLKELGGFTNVKLTQDYSGLDRVICAVKGK